MLIHPTPEGVAVKLRHAGRSWTIQMTRSAGPNKFELVPGWWCPVHVVGHSIDLPLWQDRPVCWRLFDTRNADPLISIAGELRKFK